MERVTKCCIQQFRQRVNYTSTTSSYITLLLAPTRGAASFINLSLFSSRGYTPARAVCLILVGCTASMLPAVHGLASVLGSSASGALACAGLRLANAARQATSSAAMSSNKQQVTAAVQLRHLWGARPRGRQPSLQPPVPCCRRLAPLRPVQCPPTNREYLVVGLSHHLQMLVGKNW